jgi:uncharacterized DUF497 family protein
MIYDDFFEWHPEGSRPKDLSNQEDHGYSFEEARLIWDGPTYTFQDRRVYPKFPPPAAPVGLAAGENNEIRHIAIGFFNPRTILFVVYTWRGQRKHLISAREAEPDEITKLVKRTNSRRR